jgi:WD40 repeat protein
MKKSVQQFCSAIMYLAATNSDINGIDIYDAESLQILGSLRGHADAVECMAWAANVPQIASADSLGIVKVWNVESFAEMTNLVLDEMTFPKYMSFSENGDRLLVVDTDYNITCWDVNLRIVVSTIIRVEITSVLEARFIDSASKILSVTKYNFVAVWESDTGFLQREFDCECLVNGISVSPDERLVATALENSKVATFSIKDGKLAQVLTGHTAQVYCVCFSSDGSRLASGGVDGSAIVWDLGTGSLLASANWNSIIIDISMNGDGTRIACRASFSVESIIVWDVSTESTMLHVHTAKRAAFSHPRVILM